MSIPILTFFNNKGGVGKTSLVYHVAWMMAEMGYRVVAMDLDPQANLTSYFLDEDDLEDLWPLEGPHNRTVYGPIEPFLNAESFGEVAGLTKTGHERLLLLPGDPSLSLFEDELARAWAERGSKTSRNLRVLSYFWRLAQTWATNAAASLVIVDVGPNLGALNRAALIGTDFVTTPLAADLFSLQGLRNLGPTLRDWRTDWQKIEARPGTDLPPGSMEPIGYILMQHAVRLDRPTQAYGRWAARVPSYYREQVRGEAPTSERTTLELDPLCLAEVKHYRSLMAMAQEARKPIFELRPGDGALGSHFYAAQEAGRHFRQLATRLAAACGLGPPPFAP